MDSIFVSRLSVMTRIGITEEERSSQQELKVSVEMFCDASKAGASDSIEDTIDYEHVANAVKELGGQERNTIEKFAEDAAKMILKSYNVESVKVTVEKFVLPETDSVSVTIVRP